MFGRGHPAPESNPQVHLSCISPLVHWGSSPGMQCKSFQQPGIFQMILDRIEIRSRYLVARQRRNFVTSHKHDRVCTLPLWDGFPDISKLSIRPHIGQSAVELLVRQYLHFDGRRSIITQYNPISASCKNGQSHVLARFF